MTNQEIRAEFDKVIAGAAKLGDNDAVARLEILREYLTVPAFAKMMADHVWANRVNP